MLPAEIERAERERVERRKPWLAFSRAEPTAAAKAERDMFAWGDLAEFIPIEGETDV